MNDTGGTKINKQDFLKMFFSSFIKSCGLDDLKLIPLQKEPILSKDNDKPKPEIVQNASLSIAKDGPTMTDSVVTKDVKEAPLMFHTRVVFQTKTDANRGLNLCKVREIWKSIPEVFRQDISQVSETRTKTDIEFIVQFSQPISGKNVPDLIKWTEKIEAQHLINVNVSTRQI